jgi:FkbM family methyltransferase
MVPLQAARRDFRRLRKALGWWAALRFALAGALARRDAPPRWLHTPQARHPLLCRPGASDPEVFRDVFRKQAYACLSDAANPRLVIDCGANVGYASAWLLSRFPDCHVIAIEPEAGNFALLQQNLAPYGSRARAIQAAVWPTQTHLRISETPFGDGREWSYQVRPCEAGEPGSIPAIDLGTLLAESGLSAISILKVDIEAAERYLFASHYDSWLPHVDNLAIELHGPECAGVFHKAIAGLDFSVSQHGELTVCKRRPN